MLGLYPTGDFALGDNQIEAYGVGAATLPTLTASASGFMGRSGSGAATIPALTASGTGEIEKIGVGGVTLPVVAASGTGEREITGSGSVTLGVLLSSGIGEIVKTGSSAITLPVLLTDGMDTSARRRALVQDESQNVTEVAASANSATLTTTDANEAELDLHHNTAR